VWTEGDRSPGKLKWKVYPTLPGGGRERILNREIPEDVSILFLIPGGVPCFYFHLVFP
jgi:hypothetical protein